MTRSYAIGKRLLDVALATVALVVLSPLALAIAVAIRTRMGPPILFRQPRPGRNGRPFVLIKFRTMAAPPPDAPAGDDGARITPLGRFLRSTSLDELPELWNVLRGQMSLVGPRPLLMEYLPRYSSRQARRHEVRPGITGWAQIHGRNKRTWEEKFELDVWYVDHAGPRLDTEILWRTLALVLRREGVAAPGHATMPEFRGSGGAAAEEE